MIHCLLPNQHTTIEKSLGQIQIPNLLSFVKKNRTPNRDNSKKILSNETLSREDRFSILPNDPSLYGTKTTNPKRNR